MLKRLLQTLIALAPLAAIADDNGFVGRTFRVTGNWQGPVLQANRVQLRDALDDEAALQIVGRITAVNVRRQTFDIGAIRVRWYDGTRFDGIDAAALAPGAGVRVNAELQRGGLFAHSVRAAEAPAYDDVQITGMATESRQLDDGARRVAIAEVPVRVTTTGYNGVESLTRRQDSRRPETITAGTLFGRPFGTSLDYEMQLRDRRNFDLESDDHVVDTSHEFQVEMVYEPTASSTLYLSGKLVYDADIARTGGKRDPDVAGERDQMWLYLANLAGTGFGLQVGRQNFKETREWWWDDDLDAARLYYDRGPLHLEAAVAQELFKVDTRGSRIDPAQKEVRRYIGMASWLWAPRQKLEAFVLRADDRSRTEAQGEIVSELVEDESDATLTWIGLRAVGTRRLGKAGTLEYWADVARVTGRERVVEYDTVDAGSRVDNVTPQRVRGSAIDVGAAWETPLPGKPSLTLGYARGSGDGDPDDGVDRSFRQTGLHNNKWRWFGVNRFRFYGEALRPELSNLGITTVAVGLPFLRNSSVELAWHRYRQVEAADALRDVRIDASLDGISRDVGEGLDLAIGIREAHNVDIALTAGVFRAGRAFGPAAGQKAWLVVLEGTWNF